MTGIRYLDGGRLLAGVLAGGEAVVAERAELDRINVFPVPDGDTGTNLASTMRAIARGARPGTSVRRTLESIAETALRGARGNSGLIFAQFFHGLSREVGPGPRLEAAEFIDTVGRAVLHARRALAAPVEGTLITVLQDWADALAGQARWASDFADLFAATLQAARRSLQETTRRLAVLARAGVVDAGAKGFVVFLDGIVEFIRGGDLKRLREPRPAEEAPVPPTVHRGPIGRRYCAEALLSGDAIDPGALRAAAEPLGDSLIVAGSGTRARLHIHTDDPAAVFARIGPIGRVEEAKVDDMLRQAQAASADAPRTALLTDSSCDLPPALLDEHRIHVVPFTVAMGGDLFLDKLTLTPDAFYERLASSREVPRSSQPPPSTLWSALAFLASHARTVLVVPIGRRFSGLHDAAVRAASDFEPGRVLVADSRQLSASLALLVLRAAEAARDGMEAAEIARRIDGWSRDIRFWVDVKTLRYMIRGGRVNPLTGRLARLAGVRPIVTLDREGRPARAGVCFTRRGAMRTILRLVRRESAGRRVRAVAVVHAGNPGRAEAYARRLEALLGKRPDFTVALSPVVGVHNGLGAVGVALMLEEESP